MNSEPSSFSRRDRLRSLLTAGVAAGVLAGCGGPAPQTSPPAAATERRAAPVERVVAGPPVRKTLTLYSRQPAEILPFEETPLYSKLAGYVAEVLVDIGDRVEKDQPLVKLWIPELVDEHAQKAALLAQAIAEREQAEAGQAAAAAAVRTARSQLTAAEAGVLRARGVHERWKAESDRITALAASRVVTDKLADETTHQLRSAEASQAEAAAAIESVHAQVDEAQARARKAEADTAAALARVKVAEADLARAVTMLNYCVINAPYEAVVTARNVHTHHYVQPAAAGTAPLLVVSRRDVVRVVASIPEGEAGFVTSTEDEADPVVIAIQALRGRTVEARVTRSSWSLDAANRSLRIEIDLPNPDDQFRPGMYAAVQVRLAEAPNVLTIPSSALVTDAGQTLVCVVEEGRIDRRPIETGLRVGADIEVRSGLAESDVLVLARAGGLQPGAAVEVVPPASK